MNIPTNLTDVMVGLPDGRECKATFVRVRQRSGGPVRLRLDDGTELSVDTIVNAVVRLSEEWQDNGDPIYVISSQSKIRTAFSPEELKRQKK